MRGGENEGKERKREGEGEEGQTRGEKAEEDAQLGP